ncbi:MAG: hypothetical protein ACRCX5_00910 [Bacteroidales bacterium]
MDRITLYDYFEALSGKSYKIKKELTTEVISSFSVPRAGIEPAWK